ncbi:hypothetical protein [Micromonospora humida]|uniref:hypothetical protein n=1 Tax=Micromonospora humida TaxID=2809018 RepID=UPI003437FB5C
MRVPSRSPGPQPGVTPPAPARRTPAPTRPVRPAAPDLDAYRQAVAELLVEVGALAGTAGTAARQVLLDQRLREPAIADVLDATGQGVLGARETLLLELARHQPDRPAPGPDLTALVRIYLLSRIDLMWWRDTTALATDEQVDTHPDLIDLEWLRRRGLLGFRYREQPGSVLGRGVRAVRGRLLPDTAPPTAGVPLRRTRREVVALLNDLAREFARSAPPGTPPLWVTNLAHSAEHRYRLRRLGQPAMLPSGHCLGWAVDVELAWYARFGARDVLAEILLARQSAGELNVIDEGPDWHVCLAPTARARLRSAYEAEMGI